MSVNTVTNVLPNDVSCHTNSGFAMSCIQKLEKCWISLFCIKVKHILMMRQSKYFFSMSDISGNTLSKVLSLIFALDVGVEGWVWGVGCLSIHYSWHVCCSMHNILTPCFVWFFRCWLPSNLCHVWVECEYSMVLSAVGADFY